MIVTSRPTQLMLLIILKHTLYPYTFFTMCLALMMEDVYVVMGNVCGGMCAG